MKLNDDQKKILKNLRLYAILFPLGFLGLDWLLLGHKPTWGSLLACVLTVVAVTLIDLLLVIGSKTPKK